MSENLLGLQVTPGEVSRVVQDAIDVGYRYLDCAPLYDNEREVGDAIRARIQDGSVLREELFVSTKLWNTCHQPDSVLPACKESLTNLGLDYLDLYVMHWPIAFK
ncbi:unnamed protein product, partial [Timema podura]|nr:unnamed protein product [Timema podura]